jgi:hypothetical protein
MLNVIHDAKNLGRCACGTLIQVNLPIESGREKIVAHFLPESSIRESNELSEVCRIRSCKTVPARGGELYIPPE